MIHQRHCDLKSVSAGVGRMRIVTVLLLLAAIEVCSAFAWNYGDNVPVSLSIRHNGRHSRRRPIADGFAPKFGIHRVVAIPNVYLKADDLSPKGSNATKRGFGLPKGTAIQMHFGPLNVQTAWLKLDRDSDGAKLSHLMIIFSYRNGIFSDVAAITYERRYEGNTADLTLEYVWREKKTVDTESAIIAAYVTSFVACLGIMFRLSSMSKLNEVSRVMVIRHRDE